MVCGSIVYEPSSKKILRFENLFDCEQDMIDFLDNLALEFTFYWWNFLANYDQISYSFSKHHVFNIIDTKFFCYSM